MEINYAVDITSPVNDVLMTYGSHYQVQRYTYGLDRISMDMWELEDHDNGWIPDGAGTNLSNDTERLYYLQGELNSTIKVIGEDGKTSAHYNYDEFGRPQSARKFDQNWPGPDNTFGYTGYQYDVSSGLYYAQARYYMPETGRFISEDPWRGDMTTPQTLNPYPYVVNNPLKYVDPLGLKPVYSEETLEGIKNNIINTNISNGGKWTSCQIRDVVKELASIGLSFAPVIGDIKDAQEAITGIDLVTNQKLTAGQRVITAVCMLVPIVNGKALREAGKITKIQAEALEEFSSIKFNMGKMDNKLAKELEGGICFTEDTLIAAKNGHKLIKDIKIGDKVYSKNPETGEKGLKTVKNIFINETDKLIHITVKNAEIKTTPTHPFWVVGIGWVIAAELKAGDKVQLYSGEEAEVEAIEVELLSERIKVYNFEVEDWHTYFVSENEVLVHNRCTIEVESKVPGQLLRGQEFEKVVLKEQGITKNTTKIGNSIPDGLKNSRITEIKDVKYIYKDKQFRDYINSGKPIDLIVSPQSKVSKPLQDAIKNSGGSIRVRQADGTYTIY